MNPRKRDRLEAERRARDAAFGHAPRVPDASVSEPEATTESDHLGAVPPTDPLATEADPMHADPAPVAPQATVAPDPPEVAALAGEVRAFLAQKQAATAAAVERARVAVEVVEVAPRYTCLHCGKVPGRPGYCPSCVAVTKSNGNPRIESAIKSCPPGVPVPAWVAAVGAVLAKRPPRATPGVVAQMLDVHTPMLRATLQAAFEALEQQAAE